MALASMYAGPGEKGRALDWLEKAYGEQSRYIFGTKNDFVFESLRIEPRYQGLVKKLGLD